MISLNDFIKQNPPKNKLDSLTLYKNDIKALRGVGMSFSQVADYLQQNNVLVSTETVRKYIKTHKKSQSRKTLKARDVLDTFKEDLFELKREGATYKDLQHFLKLNDVNLSISSIQYYFNRFYIKNKLNKRTTQHEYEIKTKISFFNSTKYNNIYTYKQ